MDKVVKDLTVELFFKSPIFYVIMILAVICFFFWKKLVGKAGEHWTKQELNKLNKKIYKVINDITIIANGLTHQIDHVVVSKFGIFVIETKQYNGYIKGNEYDKKWIQNNKVYISNPIHQNYGHVKSLEKVLDLPTKTFIPIVCIPSTARLKINSKSHVVKVYDLNKVIMSYTSEILPNYMEVYDKFKLLKETGKSLEGQHINRVKQIQKEKKNNYNENECPMCGGQLVERKGKYGSFIGCSNYPKCRYTKKF